MSARKLISVLSFILGLFLITSTSFAWVNPGQTIPSQSGLELAFIDDHGDKLPKDITITENNVYPGWSKEYTLRIKNFGVKARFTLGIDFSNPSTAPNLADVMNIKIIKGSSETEYNLPDLISVPLQSNTNINSGEIQEFKLVLSMDATAGNEYQGLSLGGIKLTITAEPNDQEHYYNGNNKKKTKVVVTPLPTPTPTPAPVPPVEPVEELPLPDRSDDEVIIDDDDIAAGDILPQTGGLPQEIVFAAGIALIVIGLLLRVKPVNNKPV